MVSYRVRIRIKGRRPVSKTFKNLCNARKWKRVTEAAIEKEEYLGILDKNQETLSNAIEKYSREIVAVIDEKGMAVSLMHNALNQLCAVVTDQGAQSVPEPRSSYGPQEQRRVASDLMTYAASLAWQSKAVDPTGLISMGERYYDPKVGRFISPDPIGLPVCVHLYSYAGGDPINYFDPDGRFFSPVYEPIKPALLKVGTVISDIYHSSRFQGALKATTGFFEGSAGAALMATPLAPVGSALLIHGADRFSSGMYTTITGKQTSTLTSQLLQKTGMSFERAERWDNNINFIGTIGAGGLVYKFGKGTAVLHSYRLSPAPSIVNSGRWILPKRGGGAIINGRWYTEHALERMAPRTPQVMAELEARALQRASARGLQPGTEEFGKWMIRNGPNPRGIPPSVVQAEIAQPGSTGVRVILNKKGHIKTVISGGK